MARWLLKQPHYLNIENREDLTTWQYTETDRQTGRVNRKNYKVPVLLDPEDVSFRNHEDGIVVAHEGGAGRKDYIFLGDPTPDMEPIDDEAEAITERCKPNWVHPIDGLAANGYGEARMQEWMKEMAKLAASPQSITSSVDPDAFAALQAKVAELVAQNAALKAEAAKPASARRA